jgi:hypothetical protein
MQHILRGDLVRLAQNPDLKPRRWNISSDAVINEHLPTELLDEYGAVQYRDLAALLDLPTEYTPSAMRIYEALAELESAAEAALSSFDDLAVEGEGPSAADHAEVVVRARAVDPELVRALGAPAPSCGQDQPGRSGWPSFEVQPNAARELLAQLVGLYSARRTRRRSWQRPGRLPYLIRGATRERALHVLLALDVSGSTASIEAVLTGAARWLELDPRFTTSWAVWADRAALTPGPSASGARPEVGGGTQVQSLWQLVNNMADRPDAVVVATDGEVYDWSPLPPVPIFVLGPRPGPASTVHVPVR